LGERVSHRLQEIVIYPGDRAVQIEGDHRLRAVDRSDLPGVLHAADLLFGNVGCEFDDADRLAVLAQDRIVGRLYPDLPATLGHALVLGDLKLAAVEPGPELAISGAVALARRNEHAVMLALDLLERVTHRLEKVLIGRNDRPVHIEFDYGLGSRNGGS